MQSKSLASQGSALPGHCSFALKVMEPSLKQNDSNVWNSQGLFLPEES